jgi:hypothetical protein
VTSANRAEGRLLKLIIDEIDGAQWEQYGARFADYSIYQTGAYQQVRAVADGQSLSRAAVLDDQGNVLTMCTVRVRNIRLLGLKVGYVQGGPLSRRVDDQAKCTVETLTALRHAYIPRIVDVLRVVPNIRAGDEGQVFVKLLESSGFEHIATVRPYRTFVMRVDVSEKRILEGLRKSFRRDMRYAKKAGVKIRQGTAEEFCQTVEALYDTAKKRKGFKGLDARVFTKTQSLLSATEKLNVILAYHKGQIVCAHMASNLGDTSVVLLVACNEIGLSCFASYLVWWEGALAAHRAGMKWYDLGGIDPSKNPSVSQFKSRMGGEQSHHIGLFAAYKNSTIRSIWRWAERLHGLVRR